MKIVFFIYSMSMGGAQRVVANLCNYWSKNGVDITLITIDSLDKDFYFLDKKIKRISIEQAKAGYNPFQSFWNIIKRALCLKEILKDENPNVVISFMDSANVILSLASFFLRNIIFIGAERSCPNQVSMGLIYRILLFVLYGQLDAIVALSSKSALWINSNTLAKKVEVIPNPALWPLKVKTPVVTIPECLAGKKLLLGVGRLVNSKNFKNLIDIFKIISNDFPEWSLVILGEGELRATLESQIKTLGLEGRVVLPGMAGNVAEWYERADLYVMTSEYEGFPNTLIEAMSYGCPAISFDCDTGPRDIIRHQVDGVLVEPGNIKEFELSLSKLMSNDILRDKYACRAIEVRERFSFSAVASMWDGLFSELMKNRSS